MQSSCESMKSADTASWSDDVCVAKSVTVVDDEDNSLDDSLSENGNHILYQYLVEQKPRGERRRRPSNNFNYMSDTKLMSAIDIAKEFEIEISCEDDSTSAEKTMREHSSLSLSKSDPRLTSYKTARPAKQRLCSSDRSAACSPPRRLVEQRQVPASKSNSPANSGMRSREQFDLEPAPAEAHSLALQQRAIVNLEESVLPGDHVAPTRNLYFQRELRAHLMDTHAVDYSPEVARRSKTSIFYSDTQHHSLLSAICAVVLWLADDFETRGRRSFLLAAESNGFIEIGSIMQRARDICACYMDEELLKLCVNRIYLPTCSYKKLEKQMRKFSDIIVAAQSYDLLKDLLLRVAPHCRALVLLGDKAPLRFMHSSAFSGARLMVVYRVYSPFVSFVGMEHLVNEFYKQSECYSDAVRTLLRWGVYMSSAQAPNVATVVVRALAEPENATSVTGLDLLNHFLVFLEQKSVKIDYLYRKTYAYLHGCCTQQIDTEKFMATLMQETARL